jgi:ATP-binding cassette, subfamily B (MDR/TAP), member 1
VPSSTLSLSAHTVASRRFSLQFTYVAYVLELERIENDIGFRDEEEDAVEKEKQTVDYYVAGSRKKRVRKLWGDTKISPLASTKNNVPSPETKNTTTSSTPAFWEIVRKIFPTIPYKPLLFLGVLTCIASGK